MSYLAYRFNALLFSLLFLLSMNILAASSYERSHADLVVSQDWHNVPFENNYVSPIIAASVTSFNDDDPVGLRMKNMTSNSLSIHLEEEKSADDETNHAQETVGFIIFEEGDIVDQNNNIIGEAGKFWARQKDGITWYNRSFQNNYEQPIVIINMATTKSGYPAHMRLKEVRNSGFHYQIERWDYLDPAHITEQVHYIVIEGGQHILPDGHLIDASLASVNHQWTSLDYTAQYKDIPVVLSHAQTYYGRHAIVTRQRYIDKTGIELRLQEEQASHGYHSSEDVGLITMGFIAKSDDISDTSETSIDDNTKNNDTTLDNNDDTAADDTDTVSESMPETPANPLVTPETSDDVQGGSDTTNTQTKPTSTTQTVNCDNPDYPCNFTPTTSLNFHAEKIHGLNYVYGINDHGTATGQISNRNTSDGRAHAGIWQNGHVTDLGITGCRGTVSSCWSAGQELNNNNDVAGESHVAHSWPSRYWAPWAVYYPHETIWNNGQANPIQIKTVGWEWGRTLSINSKRAIVGYGRSTDWTRVHGDYLEHGFVWTPNSEFHEIGAYNQASWAEAINEHNQVTGAIMVDGTAQAFLWENNITQSLGHLGGGFSHGKGVNDNIPVKVVGFSTNPASQQRPFIWQNQAMSELPLLTNDTSGKANAINNGSDIVGHSANQAVIWRNNTVYNLNSQLTNPMTANLSSAFDINNEGQILVKASDGYYLLTPSHR